MPALTLIQKPKVVAELSLALYSAMSDQERHDELHALDKNRNRTSMGREEIMNAVDDIEYAALTGDKLTSYWGFLAVDNIDPFGAGQEVMLNIFNEIDSPTITALAIARVEQITRLTELNLPELSLAQVTDCRT